MINIISTQANTRKISGIGKVFTNLVKGLDKIDYPYVINRALNTTKRLWVHDNITALHYLHRSKAHKVLGPNLFVLPKEIPTGIRFDDCLYLHPCEWAAKLWKHAGFSACPIKAWPVGIDTDEFQPSGRSKTKRRIMVYHKGRDTQELSLILEVLHSMRLPYWLVLYPLYEEKIYKALLGKTSFIIWHGTHESQGIALQEALSCDIPVLVLDAENLIPPISAPKLFPENLKDYRVTTAPYFDGACGIKINELSQLMPAIESMIEDLNEFSPRDFVLKNLSLEGQARAFVNLWEYWGSTFEQGLRETARSNRKWDIPLSGKIRKMRKRLIAKSL